MSIGLATIEYVQGRRSSQVSESGRGFNNIELRPFDYTESDYEAIVAIENANTPDSPFTSNEFRFFDEKWDPAFMRERKVAEQNGRIIGFVTYGQPWWSAKEGKFFIDLKVHPRWWNSDCATLMLDAVTHELQGQQLKQFESEIREDMVHITDLLQQRGFEAVMRSPQSELDVQQFDGTRFAAVLDKVRRCGIRIDSLAELTKSGIDWRHNLWDLEWEILQDVPSPEPLTRMDFEFWCDRNLNSPIFLPEGQFVARDGEQFVGMSGMWASEADPKKLYTGLTGVIRSHRRQGIATALKVRSILFAQAKGIAILETDNEENNPMLDLNKQLGFEEKPAFVSYEKKIKVSGAVKELEKEPL